jgi:hypothetical protein
MSGLDSTMTGPELSGHVRVRVPLEGARSSRRVLRGGLGMRWPLSSGSVPAFCSSRLEKPSLSGSALGSDWEKESSHASASPFRLASVESGMVRVSGLAIR